MSSTQLPLFLAYIAQFNILICYDCGHTLFSKNPLAHITRRNPTIRDNPPMLSYIRGIFGNLQPIDDVYQAIRLASPIPPLRGLPPPVLGYRCVLDNYHAIFTSKTQGLKHLRATYTLHRASSELDSYLSPYYYQGLQKNRYFFAVLYTAHTPIPQGPIPQDPISQDPIPRGPIPQGPISQDPIPQDATAIIAQLRAQLASQDPTTIGTTSRFEGSGFHALSEYSKIVLNRDLSKLRALFDLDMPDAILPSEDISKFLFFAIISLFRASKDLFPMTSRTALIRLL